VTTTPTFAEQRDEFYAGLTPADVDGLLPPPGFVAWDEIAAHLGVRQGKRILDLGQGRMKNLLAGGPVALEKVRQRLSAESATLEEADIAYLPPIPDADKFLCRSAKSPRARASGPARTFRALVRSAPRS